MKRLHQKKKVRLLGRRKYFGAVELFFSFMSLIHKSFVSSNSFHFSEFLNLKVRMGKFTSCLLASVE